MTTIIYSTPCAIYLKTGRIYPQRLNTNSANEVNEEAVMAKPTTLDVYHTQIKNVWFFRRFANGIGFRTNADHSINGFRIVPHTYLSPIRRPTAANYSAVFLNTPSSFWYRIYATAPRTT